MRIIKSQYRRGNEMFELLLVCVNGNNYEHTWYDV